MTDTAVLEERLRSIEAVQSRIESKLDKVADDHESRLRRVEGWLYALPPTFLLAVGSAVGAVLAFVK